MQIKLLDRIQLSGKYQFMFRYPYHQIGIDRQYLIPSAARGEQPASGGRQGVAARPAGDGGREGRGGPSAREAGSDGDAREAGSGGAASRVEDDGGERETRGTGATRFQRIRRGSARYQG